MAGQPVTSNSSSWDESVVERAKGGDHLAFGALYERFAPWVHGVLVSVAPLNDVDDLVQEVFLDAWRGLPGLHQGERIGAWLAAIARNRARRAWRRRPRGCAPLPDDVADPGTSRSRTPNGEGILAILRTLPETYRETLALRLVEGLNGPEIADVTGMTHGSVRVNLSRGMTMLRDKLRREGWR